MTESEQHETQMELTGPGRRLMEARRALNLSREDVARELRLKLQTIIAIEEDRVDELPAPMYVVGYLRNYAKLLKLPHEPLVDSFEQLHVEAPPIINDIVKPQKVGMTNKVVKWGSVLVVVLLLAGFVSWLQTQDFDLLSVSVDTRPADSSQPAAVEVEAEAVVSQQTAPSETGDKQAAREQDRPQVDAEHLAEPAAETVDTATAGDVITEAGPDTEAAGSEQFPQGDKIVVTLVDDCWVEIRDVKKDVIIYDLLRKGRTHTFYGLAPFTVFLGNAAAVKLYVNDQEYDVTPHIRGKLASFTMDAPDSNE